MANTHLSLFPAERIAFDLPSASKNGVIATLLDIATEGLDLADGSRKRLINALLAREKSGSTGMGSVAIPHVKSNIVDRTVAALGVFPQGLDFQAADGEPVYSLFLLVSPKNQAEEHIQVLRWIAGMARKSDFSLFMRQTKNPQEVHSLLDEMSA